MTRPRPRTPGGDVPALPERAGDDTDEGWSEPSDPEGSDGDERLESERPPHWE